MHVAVVTPPAPVVTLDEAKAQLRIDFDEDDRLIEACVAAATQSLDGPLGRLRRSIGRQVLVASIDGFPCGPLRLPYPPIGEVKEVRYVDVAGQAAVVSPSDYLVSPSGVLDRAPGRTWPAARSRRDVVAIEYSAGFESVPSPVKQAVLMIAADLYASRGEAVAADLVSSPMIRVLLAPFQMLRV